MLLTRIKDNGEATIGLLGGQWWTVERPWKDNALGVSCIPAGDYVVRKHVSPSKGACFEIQDVPERTHILIHVANWSRELQGCIAPGQGINLRSDMVTSSRAALDEMLLKIEDEWTLEIRNAI